MSDHDSFFVETSAAAACEAARGDASGVRGRRVPVPARRSPSLAAGRFEGERANERRI